MVNVGKIVKEKREAIGISQNQLAKKAGISQAALSALESETKNPSIETVFMLAIALDCSASELIGDMPASPVNLTPRQKRLLEIFQQLNDDGKDELLSQAEYFLSREKYRQEGSMSSAV